ncbi:MAG: hypothetical protein ACRC0Q_06365 [Kurthia gibsonii]|uniref:hypothetical protein n=1 Tax=Kurthia TaxID=1649 RepID=UPI000745AE24|nr:MULTISPECIES: hypothetical protein [Kurthia]MCA9723705.1 hypothetical protein [Kurthia sp.]AMA62030.1 putative membrane protein [Kurthia sp. 11kri321]MEB6113528.1 hypothetical protein [Kurthia gibsonii]MEB7772950.1 hypothetical protein [Kurthia gibsonii]WIL38447.1 hypothetical protein QN089_14270 [Kurthia sp. YJT4]
MKIIGLLILGILLSLFLVTFLEDIGLLMLAGLGLGSLFVIIYQLERNYKNNQ